MTAELAAGISAASLALMGGLAFRATATPLAVRIALPALAVASAALVPWLSVTLSDSPRAMTLGELPTCVVLRAFSANDDAGTADLWLAGTGRIVRVPLDPALKGVLGEARAVLAKQPTVRICRDAPPQKQGQRSDQGGPDSDGARNPNMHIDRRLFDAGKEAAE